MSIQKLLVDFPNYSARKIRRLAKQISLVEQAASHMDEPAMAKGIVKDLEDFNLLQAEMESQLNDDIKTESPKSTIQELVERGVTDRIYVTSVSAARTALEELHAWIQAQHGPSIDGPSLQETMQKCKEIINGQSFYTDRTSIQAKLNPQGHLSFNQDD